MDGVVKLISGLLALGFTLASAGTLVEVTNQLKVKAAHEHRRGLIKLGAWNRQLLTGNASGKQPLVRGIPRNSAHH